jgi:hypothetical protein
MNAPLIVPEGALLPEQVSAQVQLIQQVMRDVMKDGEHYGVVPGCGTKPALLKPGAEKLCFTFQLVPNFEVKRQDYERNHREYEVRCRLTNRAGVLIAEGLGTCSTYESKYRYRNADRTCPTCGKPALMKSKRDPEFYCWTKKDGCGATFPLDDKRITEQQVGKVENPDIADQWNTVLKMATKRAHVAATITACAASDLFTQDIDENAELAKPQEEAPQGNGQPGDRLMASAARFEAEKQGAAQATTDAKPTTTTPAATATTEPKPADLRQAKANFDAVRDSLPQGPKLCAPVDAKRIAEAFKRAESATCRDQALECIRVVAGDHVTKPNEVPSSKVEPLIAALRQLAGEEI